MPEPWTHHVMTVNGFRMHYVTAGSGYPLVFLHGWPQTWYEWRKLIPPLADHLSWDPERAWFRFSPRSPELAIVLLGGCQGCIKLRSKRAWARSPKAESRNPKEGRKPKSERQLQPSHAPFYAVRHSGLGIRPSFGLRVSAFGLRCQAPRPSLMQPCTLAPFEFICFTRHPA